MSSRTKNLGGSLWNRWEPHIHTPGTIFEDEFGQTTLDEYCQKISECTPPIRALGVTDYLSIERYEELVKKKREGKLAGVDLLFPNVEARLDVGTVRGSGVNIHLLFSPDDPGHIVEIKRFLASLKFKLTGEEYSCSSEDLVRLGKKHDPNIIDESKALEAGATQFKISLADLEDKLQRNPWAKKNLLIAVPASSKDGSAGVQAPDHAFDAIRVSIERASQIIFSGNPKDAEFWTGQGKLTSAQISEKYSALKPCLHGSDAHSYEKLGQPDQNRYCWIKGDVTFEALRQACIEPQERVSIGPTVPRGGLIGQTISSLRVTNASWMIPSELPLNPGLVAIVGSRGSGKTALADFLAVGSYSMGAHVNDRSFIRRARSFLRESSVTIKWESDEETSGSLSSFELDESWEKERVQYLSQQFVDDLCSSEGVSDRLLDEIKRVIYNSHDETDREGASSFQELYDTRCNAILEARGRHEAELKRLTQHFLQQRKLKQSAGELNKKIEEAEKQIALDLKDKARLVSKDQEVRVQLFEVIQTALTARKVALETEQRKVRALKALQSDVSEFRSRTAPAFVGNLKSTRADSGLTSEEWNMLTPTISSDIDNLIVEKLATASLLAQTILGEAVPEQTISSPAKLLFAEDSDLTNQTVNVLQAEGNRLAKLIGVDKQNSQRFASLTIKIQQAQKQVQTWRAQLLTAVKADEELKGIGIKRRNAYRMIFETFVELETELTKLYSPLCLALQTESGALGKLQFVVRRAVNLDGWVATGEELFDLRKDGPFKGRGSLRQAAEKELQSAWESGNPSVADKAVDSFIEKYRDDVLVHRLDSMSSEEWGARIWEWLLATDHIEITYGLQYADVDIERLSPGTRGIVLLLLYLAIDKEDVRPLIIDQPEENLDPQSVYHELVQRFREARNRRQIIIVTHNANLVVNTDADQVIVATAGEHFPGQLPEIKYESGGLENEFIRRKVCEILEGGEKAFRERAKRLRLSFV